jgi:hypothetical protein
MLVVLMLNVVMLSVVLLNGIMFSQFHHVCCRHFDDIRQTVILAKCRYAECRCSDCCCASHQSIE